MSMRVPLPLTSTPPGLGLDSGLEPVANVRLALRIGRDLQEAPTYGVNIVSDPQSLPIDKIRVPEMMRKALNPEMVQDIAASILDIGQQDAILVRREKDHFVLIEGLHRLEACKALGERAIMARLVSAEAARQAPQPPQPIDAERQKMERLKALRLEKEAAEKLAETSRAASHAGAATRQAPAKTTRGNGTAKITANSKQSRRAPSGSPQRTLSDWIKQQERSGGRY